MNSTADKVGWVSEPDGRGTIGLIWSCFATIFLCTWSAVHPNLPPLGYSPWKIFKRKLKYLLLGIIAPEGVAICAFADYMAIRGFRKKANFRHVVSKKPWSLRQYYFVLMGGYVVQTTPSKRVRFAPTDTIELIQNGIIEQPELEDEDIDDRSKADWFTKSIALLQVTWFIAQLLARAINNLPVATFELFTLSIVGCALVSYTFYWQKPFDVQRPIVLQPTSAAGDHYSWPITDHSESLIAGGGTISDHVIFWALAFICILFGTPHLLGWNFDFATVLERWFWRSCSIGCVVIPILLTSYMNWIAGDNLTDRDDFWRLCFIFVYFVMRTYLCIETFLGLRGAPAELYSTVRWSQYFPAFG